MCWRKLTTSRLEYRRKRKYVGNCESILDVEVIEADAVKKPYLSLELCVPSTSLGG